MAANPEFLQDQFTQDVADALRRRGRTRVRIQGRSMYPALRHGVQVIVETAAYDELTPGDLIVFYDRRGIVCHRLLRKAQRQCYLKGDTNIWADPPIDWSQVLGRVTHVVEPDGMVQCIAIEAHRRRASFVARFTYLHALYYNLLHLMGRCRWWSRDSRSTDEHTNPL